MSWNVRRLGDVARVVRGISYKSSEIVPSGGVPMVNLKNVSKGGGFRTEGTKQFTGSFKADQVLAAGDLLVAATDLSKAKDVLGSPFVVPEVLNEAVFSLDLIKLEPDSAQLDTGFLYFYLRSPIARVFTKSIGRGITVMHMSSREFPNLQVPVPPLDEQKRIVAQLEDQLGKLEAVRSALFEADARTGLLGRVLLNRMLTDLASYAASPITEVCEVYQPRTISKKDLDPSGEYPVYGANGQIGMYGEFNHEHSEVTITCRGATSGTVNVIPAKAWITGNAMVVSPKDESISKGFLAAVLSATDMRPFISGTAQPQITRNSLRSLMVPIPDRETQAAFLEQLEAAQESLVHLASILSAVVSQLDSAHSSILHRAFLPPGEDV